MTIGRRGGGGAEPPPRSAGYFPSQALTFAGFALTHFSAAFCGSMCCPAIMFATWFWSSAVHFQRLITFTAGEPDFANFDDMTLSMIVWPYAHR